MDSERKANEPVNKKSSAEDIRDRARELYERDEGPQIDIDAEVKRYDADARCFAEGGAYVQAWVWVPFEEEEEGLTAEERRLVDAPGNTCSDCGANTQVPFKPSGDRPVYCRECYKSRRG